MKEEKLTKIFIKNLTLSCIIGLSEIERLEKQPVIVNITLAANASKAGESDNIRDTINYKDIYLDILDLAEKGKFNLLETIAYKIAQIVLRYKLVKTVTVKAEKPKALKLADSAGVEITLDKK